MKDTVNDRTWPNRRLQRISREQMQIRTRISFSCLMVNLSILLADLKAGRYSSRVEDRSSIGSHDQSRPKLYIFIEWKWNYVRCSEFRFVLQVVIMKDRAAHGFGFFFSLVAVFLWEPPCSFTSLMLKFLLFLNAMSWTCIYSDSETAAGQCYYERFFKMIIYALDRSEMAWQQQEHKQNIVILQKIEYLTVAELINMS